jgi:predicted O-methyltransferase YrrM
MIVRSLKSVLKTILSRYQTLQLEYPVNMVPRYGYGKAPHSGLNQIIDQNRNLYKDWLHKALIFNDHFVVWPEYKVSAPTADPAWNNGFLPGLDMVMLYTLIATERPSTYVEIGSGNSTKVAARAKKDHQLTTQIISFDPAPRAEIDQLSDSIIRLPFENADLKSFSNLKSGDIVFVDNSHRIFPNSDATVFFMDVLPVLAPGVIVHVHDVYLPYDYPQEFCDRYYSEQYMLAAFLMANPLKYKTIMPNYFVSEDAELRDILSPLWNHPNMKNVERHGGSYWIQIAE